MKEWTLTYLLLKTIDSSSLFKSIHMIVEIPLSYWDHWFSLTTVFIVNMEITLNFNMGDWSSQFSRMSVCNPFQFLKHFAMNFETKYQTVLT